MITFKQFMSEDHTQTVTFEEIISECQPFVKQSGRQGLLLRGIHSISGKFLGQMELSGLKFNVYRKSVRKDRKPLSTEVAVHDAIDRWFDKKFGIKARSGAMFCVGERGWGSTVLYGKRFAVIPIGEFKYVWSDAVTDLYEDVLEDKFTQGSRLRDQFVDENGDVIMAEIDKVMRVYGYTDIDLHYAVAENNEVMVSCDEYIAIELGNDSERYRILKQALRKSK